MNFDNTLKRVIEKRAKRALSKSGVFRGAHIAILNDGGCKSAVNAYLAKRLFTLTSNLKQMKAQPKKASSYDFIALPNTADDEATQFLDFMLSSEKKENRKKAIKLLSGSLNSEVAAYAKTKKIKYAKKDKMTSDTALLIEKLENSCKGATFALSKASRKLKWQK